MLANIFCALNQILAMLVNVDSLSVTADGHWEQIGCEAAALECEGC